MRVDISAEAAAFAQAHGGTLWVWAAYPRLRCDGMQAWMRATTQAPADQRGFSPLPAGELDVRFRKLGDREPEVLEIGLRGKRRPRITAYWDGFAYAI